MRTSPRSFTSSALAARRSADLQFAWLDAADDVQEAYVAWQDADRAEQTEAFLVYQAALDREEAAARALQVQLRACDPPVRSS